MSSQRKLFSLLISLCLIFGTLGSTTFAADNKSEVKVKEPISLGKVKLKENVHANVKNLLIAPSDSLQVVSLTLTIENNSNSEINLIDYWVNISTKAGAKLTVQNANPSLSKVPAKSKVDIIYYSNVSSSVKLSDLVVKVIQWDFTVSSYTRVLGEIPIPNRYDPIVPAGTGATLTMDNVQASLFIKQAVIGQSDTFYRPQINLSISNSGNQSIVLPDYQFYVMTKNNILYPLPITNLKGTIIDPLMEKEFELSTNISNKINTEGLRLVVMLPINEGKGKIPLAIFNLPKSNITTGEELGKFYTFSNSKGNYSIRLDSLNRLPLEDDDLIIANLTIANTNKETLPTPTLSGKFVFNGSIEKSASLSENNKIIAIQPGKNIQIQLVGKVPYTFEISKLKLYIQQKETGGNGSEEPLNLVAFDHNSNFNEIKRVNANVGFKIDDVGYRSSVKVRNISMYSGVAANVLSAQIIIENNEKRNAMMQKLAGYFEKKDGTVYPATFEYIDEKIAPGGSAIINAWTTVPDLVDTKDISLIVGKAIVETGTPTNGNEPTKEQLVGYAKPYSFILPSYDEVQQNLQDIDLLSYKLSISRIATQIWFQEKQVKFNFDYTLAQDLLKKSNTKDHKIIIEIQDADPKSVFRKEFSLPGSTASSASEDTAQFKVGTHTAEIVWSNLELVNLITTLKDFQLNIYYQIAPGYKALIATQKLPWLINRNLE